MATGDIQIGNRSSTVPVSLAGALPLTWASSEVKNLSFANYKTVEANILSNSYLYVVAPLGTTDPATENLFDNPITYTPVNFTAADTKLQTVLGGIDTAIGTKVSAAGAVAAADAVVLAAATPNLGESLATLHLALEAIDADGLAAINAAIAAKTFSHAGMNAAVTLMEVLDAISAKLPA